ncbi:hypothetical protein TELCIR_03515, partial [Teladorsagia circumcincta]
WLAEVDTAKVGGAKVDYTEKHVEEVEKKIESVLWMPINDCSISYNHDISMWMWRSEPCAEIVATVDVYYDCTLTAIFTIADIATIVQLKMRGQNFVSVPSSAAEAKEALRRSRKEFMFCIQEYLSSYTVSPWDMNHYNVFLDDHKMSIASSLRYPG